MSAAPLLRQPLATAIAAALLALGVTGTAWAASSAQAHHPRPVRSSAPTR